MAGESGMDVLEVSKHLLQELEEMGFSRCRAAKALHHSGNSSIEAAINWIVDHENDPDMDQMPLIAVNIDIESPQPSDKTEEMQIKAQELRERALRKRDEEEKKLEREKDKQRIRAGKEILEAKKIAEYNERKRYLAQRKTEKEEAKRARERIRQKPEADKAERRRMLGLPTASPSSGSYSKTSEQGKKSPYPIKSSVKSEQLRECLRSLKRNHKDDSARVRRALQTLLIYVGNVVNNPDEEKFRKIRISNPLFQDRIARLKGGVEFLELCGFEKIEGDKFLYLHRDKVYLEFLNAAGSEINSAMTNPFYGLFSDA